MHFSWNLSHLSLHFASNDWKEKRLSRIDIRWKVGNLLTQILTILQAFSNEYSNHFPTVVIKNLFIFSYQIKNINIFNYFYWVFICFFVYKELKVASKILDVISVAPLYLVINSQFIWYLNCQEIVQNLITIQNKISYIIHISP